MEKELESLLKLLTKEEIEKVIENIKKEINDNKEEEF